MADETKAPEIPADLATLVERSIEGKEGKPDVDFSYTAIDVESVWSKEGGIHNAKNFADLKEFLSEMYTDSERIRILADNFNRVAYQKSYQTATYVSKANPEKAMDTLDSLLSAGKISLDDILARFSK